MKKRLITAVCLLAAVIAVFVLTDILLAGVDSTTVMIDGAVYSTADRRADIYPVTDEWEREIGKFSRLEELTLVPCEVQLRENAAARYEGEELKRALDDIAVQCADCTKLTDISPLAALTTLKNVNLHGCMIHDLSPLANSPVEVLNISGTKVDTAELEKLPRLHTLYIDGLDEKQVQSLREKGITVILTDE